MEYINLGVRFFLFCTLGPVGIGVGRKPEGIEMIPLRCACLAQ